MTTIPIETRVELHAAALVNHEDRISELERRDNRIVRWIKFGALLSPILAGPAHDLYSAARAHFGF